MKYESNISLDSKVMAKVKFTLDRQKDRRIDRQGDSYIPQNFVCGGIIIQKCHCLYEKIIM